MLVCSVGMELIKVCRINYEAVGGYVVKQDSLMIFQCPSRVLVGALFISLKGVDPFKYCKLVDILVLSLLHSNDDSISAFKKGGLKS